VLLPDRRAGPTDASSTPGVGGLLRWPGVFNRAGQSDALGNRGYGFALACLGGEAKSAFIHHSVIEEAGLNAFPPD
jgi:hypothetical protein